MATKDSGNISGNKYSLGDYQFELRQEPVSGSQNTKYTAVCRHEGKVAYKSVIVAGIFKTWWIEANDTTADVYVGLQTKAKVNTNVSPGAVLCTLPYGGGQRVYTFAGAGPAYYAGIQYAIGYHGPLIISEDPANCVYYCNETRLTVQGSVIYNNQAFYYNALYWIPPGGTSTNEQLVLSVLPGIVNTDSDVDTVLVGRFPIELEDAGGVGPDSDWDDPGDYDEDRDPEDPTTTLYLTVTGALSGRHNDPLHDTSYSYTPLDKLTVKDYGCGGDGGHGGGGGGGAANVVIFKFATNEADHKDITTIAKRHGYGSGGGKGGKGGDGCILIYY